MIETRSSTHHRKLPETQYSPLIHLQTATSLPKSSSHTARRMGLHHCAFRPFPCHAPIGTRSRVSPARGASASESEGSEGGEWMRGKEKMMSKRTGRNEAVQGRMEDRTHRSQQHSLSSILTTLKCACLHPQSNQHISTPVEFPGQVDGRTHQART